MRIVSYDFGGNTYTCRVVMSNQGEELIIGDTKFLDVLHPGSFEDDNEGFVSKEAKQLYDKVFFFTDKASLKLSDEALIEELKLDNPEWFE